MTSLLFAYGTLQHPLIIEHVIGRVPDSFQACLKDFARYTVNGQDFPGIFPEPGAETDGTVFTEISPDEWKQLDHYESDFYVRQVVKLSRPDGQPLQAYAYVVPPENKQVLSRDPWDLESYVP